MGDVETHRLRKAGLESLGMPGREASRPLLDEFGERGMAHLDRGYSAGRDLSESYRRWVPFVVRCPENRAPPMIGNPRDRSRLVKGGGRAPGSKALREV